MSESPEPRKTAPPIRYHTMAERLPEGPVRLDALVPGDGPIELEIGFGRGMFLLERAAAAPTSRLIGVEIKKKWAYLVEQRRKTLGLEHVRAFGADIRELLPRAGPDGVLQRVFMHFPDPWWKKRHAERRLTEGAMLDDLARLLAPGGELYVQTDVEERAEVQRDVLRAHGAFDVEPLLADNPYGARSNREKRAIADGLPVYRIRGIRR